MMPQPQQTSITNTPCPLCLAAEAAPFYAKNGYVIVECAACHMRFVSPMPPPEELTAHYQKAEYFSGENDQGYLNYADMKKALQPHFQHRLQIIEAQLPQRGKILEVGCAAGYFLEEARQRGWHISGMELSQDMAHNAEQLLHIPIYTTLAAVLDRDFDAITLWEVIEHLPDPIGTLRNVFFSQLTFNQPGRFQIAANVEGLTIDGVELRFVPSDAFKMVEIGPMSATYKHKPEDPATWTEIFSPDRDVTVRAFRLTGVRTLQGGQSVPFPDASARLVKVADQKPNPDYPKTTPRGGVGRAVNRP